MSDPQFIVNASEPRVQFTALPHVSYDVLFSEDLQQWDILCKASLSLLPVVRKDSSA